MDCMVSLDEYKKLHGSRFAGLSEEEILRRFDRDSLFAAFAIKCWLACRVNQKEGCDTLAPPCPRHPGQ